MIEERASLEGQIESMRRRAEAAERTVKKLEGENRRLTGLIGEMDDNRDSLGDACRCCDERIWTHANNVKEPHHAEDCPVRKVRAGLE